MLEKCKIVSELEKHYGVSFSDLRKHQITQFILSNEIDKESLKQYYLRYVYFIVPKNEGIVNDVFAELFQDESVSKKVINLLAQIRSFKFVNDSFIKYIIAFQKSTGSDDITLLNNFLEQIFKSKQINNNLKLEFANSFSESTVDLLELIPDKTPEIINLINLLNL